MWRDRRPSVLVSPRMRERPLPRADDYSRRRVRRIPRAVRYRLGLRRRVVLSSRWFRPTHVPANLDVGGADLRARLGRLFDVGGSVLRRIDAAVR